MNNVKVCKFGGTSMASGNIILSAAKIVESDFGHAQFGHHQFECPVCCLGCDTAAGVVREYQTRFFVKILIVFSVGILFCFLFFQKLHHKGSNGQIPFLTILCGNQSIFSRLPLTDFRKL